MSAKSKPGSPAMETIDFNFNINLRSLSAIRVAVAMWDSCLIKKELIYFASNTYEEEGTMLDNEKEFRKIYPKLFRQIDGIACLPCKLREEIKQIALFQGEMIFTWIIELRTHLGLDARYLQNICFTSFGTLSQRRNFQFWKKEIDSMVPSQKEEMNLTFFYLTACSYADQDVIRKSLREILELVETSTGLKIKNLSGFKANSAMTLMLWWWYCLNRDLDFKSHFARLKTDRYPTGVDQSYHKAIIVNWTELAAYYFDKLKIEDRQKIVYEVAMDCIFSIATTRFNPRKKTPRANIVLFQLQKMGNKERKKILIEKFIDIFFIFLNTWPYHQFCIPMVDFVWNDLSLETKNETFSVLINTLNGLHCNFAYPEYRADVFEPVLENLLARTSKAYKVSSFRSSSITVFELFKMSKWSMIGLILNDPDLDRSKVSNISCCLAEYLQNGGDFDQIKEYMKQLRFSDKEKTNLLKFCKESDFFLENLIEKGNLKSAEGVLDWQCDYDEKRKIKKKEEMRQDKDNFSGICYDLMRAEKYGAVEKYLKWLCHEDVVEMKKIVKEIFSTGYFYEFFWRLWSDHRRSSLKKAQKRGLLFLKFFIDRGFISMTKEEFAENEKFLESFVKSMIFFVGDLNEVFSTFSLSADRIEKIKQRSWDKIDEYFDLGVENGPLSFYAFEVLLMWVCGTTLQKETAIKKFVASPKAAELCLTVANISTQFSTTGFELCKKIFLEWLRPHGDMNKLQNEIDKLKGKGWSEREVQRTKTLLYLCRKNDVSELLKSLKASFRL